MSEWTITESGGSTYTVDGVASGGWPDFTVGREISLGLVFEGSANLSDYRSLREFGEFLFDGSTEFGTDYREEPYFKEYIHPQAGFSSYLWKMEPDASIESLEGWWLLLTEMDDVSLYEGQRLDVTAFVVAPTSEGDRTLIEDRYEVD